MDRFTYDTLKYLREGKNPESEIQMFQIEMSCDHKYPSGKSAIKTTLWVNECQICDRVIALKD